MLGALKGYCCLSFFKGTLLHDPEQKLVAPGENAQIARQMRFTDVDEVVRNESAIRDFLTQAIHLEEAGIKIDTSQKQEIAWPQELYDAFTTTPKLEECFTKLTPGRRRGYLLFFQGAKQSATKVARIQKWIPTILLGKGMQD